MRSAYAIVLSLVIASSAPAISVTYTLQDIDFDETFDVLVAVSPGDNNGLATYNVAFSGLDDTTLDPDTFVWEENVLSNLGTDFVTRGFTAGLLEDAVGTDAYSAVNSQFQQTPIFGVGQQPVFVEGFSPAPNGQDIDLGVPALLGRLTIPGANSLGSGELRELFTPNAALFTGTDPGDVVSADIVNVIVGNGFGGPATPPDPLQPPIPFPSSVVIDFNDAAGTPDTDQPYTEDGVTMTVTPHPTDGNLGEYSLPGGRGFDGSAAARLVRGERTAVTFTAGGAPFTLHSIDFGPTFIDFPSTYDGLIETSTGFQGTVQGAGQFGTDPRMIFSGPDFTNITSFTLGSPDNLLFHDFLQFDNIVITIVPEPAAGLLVCLAAAGSAPRRRRFCC